MSVDIQYDGRLDVATAVSRMVRTWDNRPMQWSEFLERISKTQRTGETVKKFKGLSKDLQDSIKDVGGFFGGYLVGGKRSNTTVQSRGMITLDIDDGVTTLWGIIALSFSFACAIYSTHKHAPKTPRYRLLIPLKEELTPEQYEALSRHIASQIGIDYFDDTSFQPARFMYWPSTSSDGEYIFEYQDGEWLDGKALIEDVYKDWHDRSSWPYSSRMSVVVKTSTAKQGDPMEKPGVVGLFCRTYDIDRAIETFLSDVYRKEDKNRYTYVNGTTSNGLVVYENGKFAYSNHSTDPAGGHLCNAFDLVRLHLYGTDDSSKSYDKPSDMPSYIRMQELCSSDSSIQKERASEKMAEAAEEFEGLDLTDKESNDRTDLLSCLDTDKKGNYLPTLRNYRLIIEEDPALKDKIRYDEFSHQVIIDGSLPWRTPKLHYDSFWTNIDDACLRNYLNDKPYRLKASVQNVQDAFDSVMTRHTFHQIREYLNLLVWDKVERLDRMMVDYLGASDTKLNRAMTHKSFVAAVARVFDPGCKFDYVLTIIGPEGIGKSSVLKIMGGKWFNDSVSGANGINGKETMEQIRKSWMIELGELAAYKKADVEDMKQFLTKGDDQYRPAYGRRAEIYPRQCVFFATTNENNFLRGDTGNRRFWPIETEKISPKKSVFDQLKNERDQLWAEAKYYYEKGENLYLDKDLENEARAQQTEHAEEDPHKGIIEDFLDKRLPVDWESYSMDQRRNYVANYNEGCCATGIVQRNRITAIEIINECLLERIGDPKVKSEAKRINSILRKIEGWKHIGPQRTPGYGKTVSTYERIEKENIDNLMTNADEYQGKTKENN